MCAAETGAAYDEASPAGTRPAPLTLPKSTIETEQFLSSAARFGSSSGMIGMPQRLPYMHRPVLILTAAVSLASSVLIRAADDLVLDRFARYLESLRTQAGIPGLAASIIGPNSVMWERAFGRQNIDRSEVVRIDTPFHLDGGMQIVTATLVLRCAEEGRFIWTIGWTASDPISPKAAPRCASY